MTIQNDANVHEGTLVDAELGYQIQQFYFREAELLDEQRFADWLEVFDDELTYWAPLHTNRMRQAALAVGSRASRLLDETKESLASVSAATTPAWPGRRPAIAHQPPDLQRAGLPDRGQRIHRPTNFWSTAPVDARVDLYSGHRIDSVRRNRPRVQGLKRVIH